MKILRWVTTTMLLALLFGFTPPVRAQVGNLNDSTERAKIESTVQAYFEARYQAFNTLQLDGLATLAVQSPVGAAAWQPELDKLEVELAHAKLYHLRYLQYKFYLDFKEIVMDAAAQSATVSVVEGHDVVFDIVVEVFKKPVVSTMRNQQHTIVVSQEQGTWMVVSDTYDDYLWRLFKATGLSKAELLQNMIAAPGPTAEKDDIQALTYMLDSDDSTHTYDRDGAVAYAHQWATVPRPYNSPPYNDFTSPWGDCTNFVSQAIHEGGHAQMVEESYGIGEPGWYYHNGNDRASAWNDVGSIYTFITNTWQIDHWTAGPEGREVGQHEVLEGDLIQYDWNNDNEWEHSAIIVKTLYIEGNPNDRYHLIASHTPDLDNHPFTDFDYSGRTYRFIHIERLDGPLITYPAASDFNGDATTEIAVFRPSNGVWYVRNQTGVQFGGAGDIPVPGDYDGDGATDVAVFRPSNGTWYVKDQTGAQWGGAGDIPVPGDYDGNGTTDIAVFRPSNGTWYVKDQVGAQWGGAGDIPVPDDYDGSVSNASPEQHSTTEIAVFRPSNGIWYVKDRFAAQFGGSGDIPVPGDYDSNGIADLAVYRPSNGAWYVRNQFSVEYGGVSGDIPVPGDYDGDGKTDLAIFRPSNGTWYIKGQFALEYGISGDIPIPGR